MRVILSLTAAALLAGCATTQTAEPGAVRDPLEGFNRGVWGLNRGLDTVILKPVSSVYRTVTPRAARRGILRIFDNLSEPWSFVNNMLQGKPGRAVNNLGRFVVNTTLGVGGLADHATKMGIKPAREDFGQTLAAWGVKSSAYLVLPILGPSTIRDGIGSGVGFIGDPVGICLKECTNLSWTERQIPTVLNVISTRANLTETGADALLDSSADPYATARSAYLQRRALELADQDGGGTGGSNDAELNAVLKELETDDSVTPTPDAAGAPVSPETPAAPAPDAAAPNATSTDGVPPAPARLSPDAPSAPADSTPAAGS